LINFILLHDLGVRNRLAALGVSVFEDTDCLAHLNGTILRHALCFVSQSLALLTEVCLTFADGLALSIETTVLAQSKAAGIVEFTVVGHWERRSGDNYLLLLWLLVDRSGASQLHIL